MRMAIPHCFPKVPTTPNEDTSNAIKPRMIYTANCSSVSSATARKRLPIPANGNSSEVCSGVSMISLSAEGIGDLQQLASEAASLLGAHRRASCALGTDRGARPGPHGATGIGSIVSPDCFGPRDDPRGCFQPQPGPVSEPTPGTRA